MDTYPTDNIPTLGRRGAAGELASAGAILALAGLGIALLAFASMPHNQAGVPPPVAPDHDSLVAQSFTVPNLDARLYIIVVGEDDATVLRALLESESQLRERLGERQRDAEVLTAATEEQASAIAEAISSQQSIPGVLPAQAFVVKPAAIETPVDPAIH